MAHPRNGLRPSPPQRGHHQRTGEAGSAVFAWVCRAHASRVVRSAVETHYQNTKITGETAHAAGAPWRGRSALDAVELMDIGWQFRREHLRLSQRSHNVIVDGGDQPNVVPRTASVFAFSSSSRFNAFRSSSSANLRRASVPEVTTPKRKMTSRMKSRK